MTTYYVSMSTKHLKLLELLSTSSSVNLVTIALTVFELHGGGGVASEAPPVREGPKKPGLNRVKGATKVAAERECFEYRTD